MSKIPVESFANNGATPGARPQQRRFARAAVSIPAKYVIEGATDKTAGEIVNLGGGGARLASTEDLKRGEIITVHFSVPGSDREIVARGKVVLSFFEAAGSRFAHGIAFTQISTEDQATIVAHVESLQHEQADL